MRAKRLTVMLTEETIPEMWDIPEKAEAIQTVIQVPMIISEVSFIS